MADILIIDDDPDFSYSFQRIIERMGHRCAVLPNISLASEYLDASECDVVFLDVNLPDGNGLTHVRQFQTMGKQPEVIILTGDGNSDGAALAIANGAWDYIAKPVSVNKIKLLLQRTMAYRASKETSNRPRTLKRDAIIGNSPSIMACLDIMGTAANSKSNVIISGETGTGKELFARGIHENSANSGNLVVIDCTNLPHSLAESILFGHTKGSFTSAHESRDGLFKQADNGTVFLDEISELGQDLQKSLLRVLQERKFRPIGAEKELSSNFRVIAATNRNLRAMVDRGEFRGDLFYRLNGHHLPIPPLRDRKEDIQPLAAHYVKKICREYGLPAKHLSPDFLNALRAHDWPGNVREFISAIYVAVDKATDEGTLYSQHLAMEIRIGAARNSFRNHPGANRSRALPVDPRSDTLDIHLDLNGNLPPLRDIRESVVEKLEHKYLHRLIGICGSNVSEACILSGLSRARLYELLKKHSIRVK